ncbi:MAG: putative toxin-antitoxin system toxin component, PIN family [Bacteroidota bacterium]
MTRLRVVVDTNVMLVSISPRSPYHWLFRALLDEQYNLLVSTGIALEYEEVVSREMDDRWARDLMGVLTNLPSVIWAEPRYHWRLVAEDADDNKFVDCAVAGRGHAVITYDRHFDTLRTVEFPKVEVLTPEAFREML